MIYQAILQTPSYRITTSTYNIRRLKEVYIINSSVTTNALYVSLLGSFATCGLFTLLIISKSITELRIIVTRYITGIFSTTLYRRVLNPQQSLPVPFILYHKKQIFQLVGRFTSLL